MASESNTVPLHVAAQNLPIKLTEDNYFLWNSLVVPVLRQYDITTILGEGPKMLEHHHPHFVRVNAATVPHTVGCSTARALWLKLEKQGNTFAQSRLDQMSRDLQNLKKGRFMSMYQYYQSARTIANKLAPAGSPVSDGDFVKYVLNGLPADYDAFVNKIIARNVGVTPAKLYDLVIY